MTLPRLWIDVDNPPQVQYLLPVADLWRAQGGEVIVTARDYGDALALLGLRGEGYLRVGSAYGKSKPSKVLGAARRSVALLRALRGAGGVDVLLCASRSAVLAAFMLRIPSFAVVDYEYVDMVFYRFGRAKILFPDVIDSRAFLEAGIPPRRLVPFNGLKEDLTFAGIDLATTAKRIELAPEHPRELARVLVRPPAETSHYFSPESRALLDELLAEMARRADAVTILSPRHPEQAAYLRSYDWVHEPVVLHRPVPSVVLLASIDALFSSGGTMLREAAYLGVPAYSIFRSRLGDVDRHLEGIGRATLISDASQLRDIRFDPVERPRPLDSNPALVEELVRLLRDSCEA